MSIDNQVPQRKRNRLKDYDYSSDGAYFITLCTKDKRLLFWEETQPNFVGEDIILPSDNVRLSYYGKIVEESIKTIPIRYPHIELSQYVIMPNHVHMILFVSINNGRIISSPTSLSTVVGQMKRYASKKIGEKIWQRSFYDHIIRDRYDYEKISRYIYENPVIWQYDCFYIEK